MGRESGNNQKRKGGRRIRETMIISGANKSMPQIFKICSHFLGEKKMNLPVSIMKNTKTPSGNEV